MPRLRERVIDCNLANAQSPPSCSKYQIFKAAPQPWQGLCTAEARIVLLYKCARTLDLAGSGKGSATACVTKASVLTKEPSSSASAFRPPLACTVTVRLVQAVLSNLAHPTTMALDLHSTLAFPFRQTRSPPTVRPPDLPVCLRPGLRSPYRIVHVLRSLPFLSN